MKFPLFLSLSMHSMVLLNVGGVFYEQSTYDLDQSGSAKEGSQIHIEIISKPRATSIPVNAKAPSSSVVIPNNTPKNNTVPPKSVKTKVKEITTPKEINKKKPARRTHQATALDKQRSQQLSSAETTRSYHHTVSIEKNNTHYIQKPFSSSTSVSSIKGGNSSSARLNAKASPDYLRNPPPIYPRKSKINKEQGVVYLHVDICQKGEVKNLFVNRSSGYKRLDKAAVESVSSWKFKPAKAAGIAVASSVIVPVRYILNQ